MPGNVGTRKLIQMMYVLCPLSYDQDPRKLNLVFVQRIKFLLLITAVLTIRSLALLVVHVLSLVTIPVHLVSAVRIVIYIGWIMVDPTLCYVALYALLYASRVPPPIRFRIIAAACAALVLACIAVVFRFSEGVADAVESMPKTETQTIYLDANNGKMPEPDY
jgi:hypothetical protein